MKNNTSLKETISALLNNKIDLIDNVELLIEDLRERGFDNRDRLLRKMIEELGEYAEAIEYYNGSIKKIEKFKDKGTPTEKLREEIVDVFMIVMALGQLEDLSIYDIFERLKTKLEQQKSIHETRLLKGHIF